MRTLMFDNCFDSDEIDEDHADDNYVIINTQTMYYTARKNVTVLDDSSNPSSPSTEYIHFWLSPQQVADLHPSLRRFFRGAPANAKNSNNGPNHVFGHCDCEPEFQGQTLYGRYTLPNGQVYAIEIPNDAGI